MVRGLVSVSLVVLALVGCGQQALPPLASLKDSGARLERQLGAARVLQEPRVRPNIKAKVASESFSSRSRTFGCSAVKRLPCWSRVLGSAECA